MIDRYAVLIQVFHTIKLPLLFVLAAVLVVYLLKKGQWGVKKRGAYIPCSSLFTAAEWLFYSSLIRAVDDQFLVFGKVRIADVLNPDHRMNKSDWHRAFNRISSKHFDFVLCDRITQSIIAVIELDDRSHLLPSAIARDSFVNQICKESGLPLIRFRVSSSYPITFIRSEILSNLYSYGSPEFSKSPLN
ncbi:DUF2726 domain-containing protein [Nitrosomonas sp.]|uniref:DUF2726 domain-containing protein n=1 Tax=Nitrosomonas sp. TaxID=42353 RepID=UPI0033060F96